jgi:bacillolysin
VAAQIPSVGISMTKGSSIVNRFYGVLCWLIGALMACSSSVLAWDLPSLDSSTEVRKTIHRETGKVRFIGSSRGNADQLPGASRSWASRDYTNGYLGAYGRAFGIDDPDDQLQVRYSNTRSTGGTNIRYNQIHKGVPVFGGELILNMDRSQSLLSMSGEISPDLDVDVTPRVTSGEARGTALEAVAKWHSTDTNKLQTTELALAIYDARLLKPSFLPPHLVWRMEVTSISLAPINELVLVDALTGIISLHFNQVHTARDRKTYDGGGTDVLPGILKCSEGSSFPSCASGDQDVIDAHQHAADAYDFYSTTHGRDSFDDAGGTLIATVHWNDGESCPNAFWDNTLSQMVYCDNFPGADDIVGHELTHGVTRSTSNLYYYYQSGAINESLSDVWGEFIDLSNGTGNDTAGVRWLSGEDLTIYGGAIRNMKNPPAFNDPDKMSSGYYWTSPTDGGGVHTNSGINNKAAYLMTDGDTFNGITVTGLGIEKTAKIYYEAQTTLLTSGSDYADLYDALYQACQNLVGTSGISAADCLQVRSATDAVEMDGNPAGSSTFAPDPPMCSGGLVPGTPLFTDDFESGGSKWRIATLSGTSNPWVRTTGYASSGLVSLWGKDIDSFSDSVVRMSVPVVLPPNTYLHFSHAFKFEPHEALWDTGYDGGVLEYSTNGSTWIDMSSLFDAGMNYNGTIDDGTNPLSNRPAFTDESHGYVSSRYDLNALSGQNFQVRYRVGTDSYVGDLGWLVDDVSIYQCVAAVAVPQPPTITSLEPGDGEILVRFSPGSDGGSAITSYTVTCNGVSASGSSSPITVTGLENGTTYSCTVTATNAAGTSSSSQRSWQRLNQRPPWQRWPG